MSFLKKFLQDEQDESVEETPEKTPETTLPETGAEVTLAPLSAAGEYQLPLSEDTRKDVQEQVVAQLREIYDPEIPVNIYELGLIYEVNVSDDANVEIIMTLTTPHCPVAESMPGEVELKVMGVPGVKGANVELVWDPPWTMYMMSEAARLEMGFM
ncbi:SUF system Fe-S cluster assembly protein [Paremcibacter congregatus]|uniref:SUF system Fe-S cluster assembly protein n=1 Tax=Paremcibacter congregatus TaxID=2043170 RepID=A0A2G4YPK0_9PROT|nr:SUF system Fe-S cluster assembly protein [Paremcibacter congregatus]PHZ84228.1 SUF system Fe-S cluster assembly protein [Paremcibacter congregatus]QDE29037.1 SUF system Fe-S cluster assembly protein [Paremcibacter congregatus]